MPSLNNSKETLNVASRQSITLNIKYQKYKKINNIDRLGVALTLSCYIFLKLSHDVIVT